MSRTSPRVRASHRAAGHGGFLVGEEGTGERSARTCWEAGMRGEGYGVRRCRNQDTLPCLHRIYLQVCKVEEARGGVARVELAQHAAVWAVLHHAQADGHKRMGKLACE